MPAIADGRAAALRPRQHGQEQHRDGAHRHLEDLAQTAVARREHHAGERREPDERDRAPAGEHPVELVQADAADRDHEQRKREPAEVDEHDRDDRRRDGDQDPGEQVRALPLAPRLRRRAAPLLRAASGGRSRSPPRLPRVGGRRADGTGYRPPKRRLRAANS